MWRRSSIICDSLAHNWIFMVNTHPLYCTLYQAPVSVAYTSSQWTDRIDTFTYIGFWETKDQGLSPLLINGYVLFVMYFFRGWYRTSFFHAVHAATCTRKLSEWNSLLGANADTFQTQGPVSFSIAVIIHVCFKTIISDPGYYNPLLHFVPSHNCYQVSVRLLLRSFERSVILLMVPNSVRDERTSPSAGEMV